MTCPKQSIVDKENACPFVQEKTGNLLEYSVVYSDRAVNLMSNPFVDAMKDISKLLREAYKCDHVALIPGSGTYAMEAVARQFGTNKKCLVLRNGFFSFRWSDIFEVCKIPSEEIVLKATVDVVDGDAKTPVVTPLAIEKVIEEIKTHKPAVVFAPHVETSTGVVLPDDYLAQVAKATHEVGGLFVLDGIAAGTLWADMKKIGHDVYITAPQKGWSGPACVGVVVMNDAAKKVCDETVATSYCCNLSKWLTVMQKYEAGGFMYYTTLPTDALCAWAKVMKDLDSTVGLEKAQLAAEKMGQLVRDTCEKRGLKSVAAEGFKAPTVVVSYSTMGNVVPEFKKVGLQIAGGVPYKLGEPSDLNTTFRIGLFGIDKMANPEKVAETFTIALDKILA